MTDATTQPTTATPGAPPAPGPSQTTNVIGGIIAIMVIGLLWFIVYALVFIEIPVTNQTNLATIIGLVGLQIGIIIGWFFRGSQNESTQSKTISTLVATASKAQDALPPVPGSGAPTIPVEPGAKVVVEGKEPKP